MPTGLYVIGSRGAVGGATRRNLMTANLVMQVSTGPKLIGAAIDVTSVTRGLVEAGGAFTVSLLARADRALVRRFVKPVADVECDPVGRATSMAGVPVAEAPSGLPVLGAAAAWLDCEVRHRLDLGRHILFIGEVTATEGPDGDLPAVLRMEDTRMNYGG
jgi:flavin reductase (DIM6/NTAB) family NADH-FMN oxidoreductase RutF